MDSQETSTRDLALRLYEINAFKFGEFTLKSGLVSPVYFDLRVIVSHPDVMDTLCTLIWDFADTKTECHHLCGVPYTALPIASIISVRARKPLLIRRKEAKSYGTKKLIEGQFSTGEKCLIIEDVVTSGASILETVCDLRSEGLKVTDAIVVVDREQGGRDNIESHGVTMHTIFTLTQLLNILKDVGKINQETVDTVTKFLANSQVKHDEEANNINDKLQERVKMTFEERGKCTNNELSKKLFQIMYTKETTLCLSADLTRSTDILNLAELLGPYICLLKTHCDIIEDFSKGFVQQLTIIAEKHNFLILEDRKFADIGNTVQLQLVSGLFNIASWANFITVHGLSGPGVLDSIQAGLKTESYENIGVFMVAEMSSKDNLFTPSYTAAILKQAVQYPGLVTGLVCQSHKVITDPGMIQLTPGVQLSESGDHLDQIYNIPDKVVKDNGADIAVVGRGIIKAKNPESAAKMYRDQLWQAYRERVEH